MKSGAIAILGGSFNPIHNGHLAIAEKAYRHFSLDQVLFVPAKDHAFEKSSLTLAGSERKKIVELAIADTPYFECWSGELEREGKSYAVDTILQIKREYFPSKIYWIIGADNLESFNRWYKYEEILENVTLAVTERPQFELSIPDFFPQGSVEVFPSPLVDLSSTDVRNMALEGTLNTESVPQKVCEYILGNNIYC